MNASRRTGNDPRQTPPANRSSSRRANAKAWLRTHADAAFVLLAATLPVLPLLAGGTSCGHDLSFHLLNWMEVATQWQHGTLRPFWAFHAAWNAGEPRFVFYPPLSWSLGALLGLLLPWVATPIAFTFVALLAAGLTMRVLLRRFAAPLLATAGACVYLANPYMLFVAYERTAYAELLAAAWMPLLLLGVLGTRVRPLLLATALALLWLTNAPAAVVGSYALLLLAVLRLLRSKQVADAAREAAALCGGTLLGMAVAAFYLLPALAQRQFVRLQMAVLPGMRPADNFLFGHTGDSFHDAVLRSASWIAVGVLVVALLCAAVLLVHRQKHRQYASMRTRDMALHGTHEADRRMALLPLAVLSVAVLFLLTRWSAPVWTHAPQLAFLQFPWRFLSIESAVAVVSAVLLCTGFAGKRARLVLVCAMFYAALTPWAAHALYRQPCDDEDAPAAQVSRFHDALGSEPTDEYTPADADNDALHKNLPAMWLTQQPDGGPDPSTLGDVLSVSDGHPDHLQFEVRASPTQRALVVRVRQFAGWQVMLDGQPEPGDSDRDDGLIRIPLTPNTAHSVAVVYRWTVDEKLGTGVSVLSLLLFLFLWDLRLVHNRRSALAA